jgi:hypothetical protein
MKKINRIFMLAALGAAMLIEAVRLPSPAQAQTADPVLVGAGDIVTCNGTHDDDTARLLDNINGTVFTLGDNVYPDGTAAQFTDCYGPTWGRQKARTRPAVGNHDYHTTGAAGYYGYFGQAASPLDNNCTSDCKGYYSYNLGAWHIIVINSEAPMSKGSVQEQWLRSDLASNPNACTLAYFHAPRFSSGLHGDASKTQAVWDALYQYSADVVVNGHDHIYERFAPQNPQGVADAKGIREFVVGTGGASLYDWTTIQPNSEARNNTAWGVLKLTLHSTSYDWEFVPVAGMTYKDSGTANCVGAGTGTTATKTPTPNIVTSGTQTPTPAPSYPTATPVESLATPTASGSTSDALFADDFESGNFSSWSANKTDSGDLQITGTAALKGSMGMQAVIDDNRSIFLTDNSPNAEPRYRARFYFDPNSIKMADGNAFFLLNGFQGGSTAIMRVEMRMYSGSYQLRARLIKDGASWAGTNWFPINNAAHAIEIDWRAASAAGKNDGGMGLWIDGTQKADLTGIDNDTWRIDTAKLGAVAGIDSGTRGTIYIDAFESRRQSYIGLLP